MNLTKTHYIVIAACIALFCFLYFGMSTKPQEQKDLEKSRSATIEATGIQNIVMEAKKKLAPGQMNVLEAMQSEYQRAEKDSAKIEYAKQLASKWYELGAPIVSGYYAEDIAKIKNDKESWSIAGTTYSLGLQIADSDKEKKFAKGRAVKAFENAISLEEDNVDDQINLALIYVDHPDESPMEGIQKLLRLNESYPDNVNVLNQLARLSLRTNQTEKALGRLTKALEIDPDNNNSICLIAQAYEMAGDNAKAAEFQNKCRK